VYAGLRLRPSRSKVAQQPRQCFLVAVVVFPPAKVSDVPATPYVCRPGLRRARHRVVDTDREQDEALLALITPGPALAHRRNRQENSLRCRNAAISLQTFAVRRGRVPYA
jgi:hypothetical protein